MTQWIEALCEPKQLFLVWQPRDPSIPRRYRWAVALIERGERDDHLRYFAGAEFAARNDGKPYAELEALGYKGYPAFDRSVEAHSQGVRSAFLRRLPPRARSDFAEYAAQFALRADATLSDFALLARTGAQLPSDGFSLVDPLDGDAQHCDLLAEVAGPRKYPVPLQVDQAVQLVAEPDNPHDPHAVRFEVEGQTIGYVNRLQAPSFGRWLREASIEATVARLSGTADDPRVFVFVRVRPRDERLAA